MARQPTDRYHWGWHRTLRYLCQRVIFGSILTAELRVRVEGHQNVKGLNGPFILVANHSSHLDAATIYAKLPYRLTRNLATGVAADYFYEQKWKSLFTSFFVNSYPVDRAGRGPGRQRKKPGLSVSLLRSGIPLCIFPEGTRSRDGVMRRFTPGAAALARSLRVPVVPVAIIGAHEAMPVGTNWPKPGRPEVKLLIGEPLRAHAGEQLPQFNARVEAQVRAMIESEDANVRAVVPEVVDDEDGASQDSSSENDSNSSAGVETAAEDAAVAEAAVEDIEHNRPAHDAAIDHPQEEAS